MGNSPTGPRGGSTTVTQGNKFRKTLYFEPMDWWSIERQAARLGCSYSQFVEQAVRFWAQQHPLTLEIPLGAATASPLTDVLGRLHGELEVLLAKSRARLPVADLAGAGVECCWARWKGKDGDDRRLWLSDTFESLTGYSTEEFESIGREGLVHPDDLPSALRHVDGPIGHSRHEFRILTKEGDVRWLLEEMQVSRDEAGEHVLGVTRDITTSRSRSGSASSTECPLGGLH